MDFEQRKQKAKKLAALYAKALDAAHKIEKQLKELGFDAQGKQIRTFKGNDPNDIHRDAGRNRRGIDPRDRLNWN